MPTGTPRQSAARDAVAAAAGAAAAHGAAQVASAQHTMASAVARAEQANEVAADAVGAMTEHLAEMGGSAPTSTQHSTTAPGQPWLDAWDTTAGEVSRAAGQFGDFAASVSGYYAEHPDQLGTLIGSSLTMGQRHACRCELDITRSTATSTTTRSGSVAGVRAYRCA